MLQHAARRVDRHACPGPGCSAARRAAIESIVLEDQDGTKTTFKAFFRGQPTIVVFFYTRCDNPMKCSLTITKLARVQALLEAGASPVASALRRSPTIPAFDLPDRLRIYGQDRGVRMDAGHRLFRATEDNDALQEHFGLGVGFVGSLVNRHRIELYILDAGGRVAVSFEQLRWDEQEVVARAAGMLMRAPDEGDVPYGGTARVLTTGVWSRTSFLEFPPSRAVF